MIQGKRAAVRPRVRLDGGAHLLLEDEIRALIEAGDAGTVAIVGGPGSGKTTALEHLVATLSAGSQCTVLDEREVTFESLQDETSGVVVVAACSSGRLGPRIKKYELAAWTRDDVIEYLLATHKDECASVISRVHADALAFLEGLPQLCRIICDQLASDASTGDAKSALRRSIHRSISDDKLARRVGAACLSAAVQGSSRFLRDAALPADLYVILRHRPAQLLVAAETLVAAVRDQRKPPYLDHRLPRGLVHSAAEEIRNDDQALDRLRRLAGHRRYQPMAASILHHAGAMPAALGRRANLRGAHLSGIVWPNAKLVRADLREADLCGADLRDADLTKASIEGASLAEAQLTGALLNRACLNQADLSNADLSAANAEGAFFDEADLSRASFAGAVLSGVSLTQANLEGANFAKADLCRADLADARIAGADFTDATLDGSRLAELRLREAELSGASFVGADLAGCDLENVELPSANFSRADLRDAMLSGSVIQDGDFSWASLNETGLAEIDWEGACLCNADLRGATFHMGGSRSGLVGSPIASEGSRTGFYTDESEEQHFKSPEEIRKANLCGVDLRGAIIDGVDFYLVDLRGARYDPDQEQQLRRSGAILEARV